MRNYDIDNAFSSDVKLVLTSLVREIWDETLRDEEDKDPRGPYQDPVFEKIRRTIDNTSKDSGLIQRLCSVGLNLWPLDGADDHEKFDALKILKLFYRVEHPILQEGVNIVQVLRRPRQSNLYIFIYGINTGLNRTISLLVHLKPFIIVFASR